MIKIGICGFGKAISEFHIPRLKGSRRFKIVSVFDIISERLSRAKEELGSEVYNNYNSFLKSGIDLALIATPSNFHSEYALKTIKAGIGVILEKPMALSVKDCDEIIGKAKAKKAFLTVHHNRRWDGDYLAIKKIVTSGKLGKIEFLASRVMNYGPLLGYSVPEFDTAWRYKKGFGGGQLFDFGSHLIDQVLDLLKNKPLKSNVELKKELWSKETDTYFKLLLEFEDKTNVEIIASQISKKPLPRWEIRGKKGLLLCQTSAGPISLKIDGKEKLIKVKQNQYHRFYDNLYNALTKGEKLIVEPEQARDVVSVIEKAYNIYSAPSSSPA